MPTSKRLPSGVERALADSLSLDHPDVPWTPPAVPPATSDLRVALQLLEAEAAPATPKHVAWCLAKLMMAFEPATKVSPEDSKLRAAVWMEACGDLGDALWSSATMAALQGSKWMPKPAEFRAYVSVKLEERSKRIARCKAMLSGLAQQPEAPKAFVAEPDDVRIRHLRDSMRRVGNMGRAVMYEKRLAEMEGRPVEAWSLEPVPMETPEREERPPPLPMSAPLQASLDMARARFWRDQGRTALADRCEQEAKALAPEIYGDDDIPEAAHA